MTVNVRFLFVIGFARARKKQQRCLRWQVLRFLKDCPPGGCQIVNLGAGMDTVLDGKILSVNPLQGVVSLHGGYFFDFVCKT